LREQFEIAGDATMTLVFDHVGIVVRDIDEGCRNLEAVLGELQWTQRFDDSGLGVSVQFARDTQMMVYELIAPYGSGSPIERTLRARRDLLNQIAYRTDSLSAAASHLRETGAVPVSKPHPALAFNGANVQFFLTKLGFLIEVIEQIEDGHKFELRPSG
jgi:methylmalonyl-CoA/ethylmalonyl-CoA epimerase